jgi:malonyl CoA-acyl carrier protein transacylase
MKTIIVFPGQGSQRVGMASDFYEHHAAARAVFEEASDALNYDVARLCFDDHERIHLTEFTQPAIVTAEIAMYRALQDQYGLTGEAFAGHSLGEYAALLAAKRRPDRARARPSDATSRARRHRCHGRHHPAGPSGRPPRRVP